jgi:two-component system chemotaxis sensor kinase CheA
VGIKLTAAILLCLVAATALIYQALVERERESLLTAKAQAAAMVTSLFAANSAAALEFEDEAAINDALAKLKSNTTIAYGGLWPVDGMTGSNGARAGEYRAEGYTGAHNDAPQDAAATTTHDGSWMTSSIGVTDALGNRIGQAVVVFSLAKENAALAASKRNILGASVGIAAVVTLLLTVMARLLIVRPLDRLVGVARKLEQGATSEGIAALARVQASDEVGRLGVTIRGMAQAIEDRELQIRAAAVRLEGRNADMRLLFDNVDQGFATVNRDGTLDSERSAAFDAWFGAPAANQPVWSLWSERAPELATWFELGWEAVLEDVLPLELALEQLPARAQVGDKALAIAYRPIFSGEQLQKVMLVINDITAELERERAEAQQKEMVAVFLRIGRDRAGFVEFVEESQRLVDAIQREQDVALLKRQIHTLKGNTGIFDVPSVARVCHDVETAIETSGAPEPAHREAVLSAWASFRRRVEPLLGSQPDGAFVTRAELDTFAERLRQRANHEVLLSEVLRWPHEPAQVRLARFADQAARMAERLGKPHPKVVVDGGGTRVPQRRWAAFWGAFAHAVNNAMDHGIEPADVRIAAGKPTHGRIELRATKDRAEFVLELCDDGAGVDWERVRARAESLGLPVGTDAELQRSLFADGLSTRDEVTTTSGRGVGMAAVLEETQALGGKVEITSTRGHGTTFRFRFPLTALIDTAAPRKAA